MREINFETAPAKGQQETWRADGRFIYYDDPDTGNTVEICRCGMADSPRNRADAQRIAREHNTAPALAEALRDVLAMLTSPKFSGWIDANCADDELWAMTAAMTQRTETIRAALALVEGGGK